TECSTCGRNNCADAIDTCTSMPQCHGGLDCLANMCGSNGSVSCAVSCFGATDPALAALNMFACVVSKCGEEGFGEFSISSEGYLLAERNAAFELRMPA